MRRGSRSMSGTSMPLAGPLWLVSLTVAACGSGAALTGTRTTAAPSSLASPSSSVTLPSIPSEGVLIDQAGVATARSLDGTRIVRLPGYSVSRGAIVGSAVWLRDAAGVTWRFEPRARRLVRSAATFDTDEGLQALGRLPKPPGERVGHWRLALAGPHGQLLAQWSGECEVPTTYVVSASHRPRLVGRDHTVEALARGWTRAGKPLIEFPDGACGSSNSKPGLYQEDRPGQLRLIAAGKAIAYYAAG
jgi:hypothetical protein